MLFPKAEYLPDSKDVVVIHPSNTTLITKDSNTSFKKFSNYTKSGIPLLQPVTTLTKTDIGWEKN